MKLEIIFALLVTLVLSQQRCQQRSRHLPRNVCVMAFEAGYCNVGSWGKPLVLFNGGSHRFWNIENDMDSFILQRGCRLRIISPSFRDFRDYVAPRSNWIQYKLPKMFDDNIGAIECYC